MNGPASDSPNPMWLSDVAQQSEKKDDILSSRNTEGTKSLSVIIMLHKNTWQYKNNFNFRRNIKQFVEVW